MQYNKPHLPYNQQLILLESRGLTITDVKEATDHLKEISYYRLSAYSLPFQQKKDLFNSGTLFTDLIDLYCFDRELRFLVFSAIEGIEIAIRTQIIYQLSAKYGSHWQDDPKIFVGPYTHHNGKVIDVFSETQKIIQDHYTATHPEVFLKHYKNTYSSPITPPSWMSIEMLTIGQLSRLFKALKLNQDKKDIADFFGIHHTVFISWLHSITYVRNICAHHSRLWNRELAIKPDVLQSPRRPWINVNFTGNNQRCFYFLCTLKYMFGDSKNGIVFKNNLLALIKSHPKVPIKYLGIPSNIVGNSIDWVNEPIWKT